MQYRIEPDQLDRVLDGDDPAGRRALAHIAWEEVGRFTASSTVDQLLGPQLSEIGDATCASAFRAACSRLGLEVVYVGVTNVHPEKTRRRGLPQRRQGRAGEGRRHPRGPGDRERAAFQGGRRRPARPLPRPSRRAQPQGQRDGERREQTLRAADPAVAEALAARLKDVEPLFQAQHRGRGGAAASRRAQREVEQDFELGLGRTLDEQPSRRRERRPGRARRADDRGRAGASRRALAGRSRATGHAGPGGGVVPRG